MQRVIFAMAFGAANSVMTANFETPRVGQTWEVQRISVRCPNWVSGMLAPTRVLLDGREMMASRQGQADVAGGEPFTVYESQLLQVQWTIPANAQFTGTQLNGIAEAIVDST